MNIMFKVNDSWGAPIEAMEVEKETDKMVFYVSRKHNPKGARGREMKVAHDHRWFHKFSDAQDYALGLFEKMVARKQVQLDNAKGRLGNAKGLTETRCIDQMKGVN